MTSHGWTEPYRGCPAGAERQLMRLFLIVLALELLVLLAEFAIIRALI